MKNTFTRLLGVSAVSLFALTTQLSAQISAFTYQGALTQSGQPANGTYDFMFRLMNAPTDGAAAPVIPVNPGVGVTNGLFTTGIDFDAENLKSELSELRALAGRFPPWPCRYWNWKSAMEYLIDS